MKYHIDEKGNVTWSPPRTLGEAVNELDEAIADLERRLAALRAARAALEPLRNRGT